MAQIGAAAKGQTWGYSETEDGQRTYNVDYVVRFNSVTDGPLTAANAYGVPTRGMAYVAGGEYDFKAFCKSKSVKYEEGMIWTVTCNFSTDPKYEHENPIDRKPRFAYSSQDYSIASFYDIDGKPVLNSAKDRYSEPFELPMSIQVISMSRNVANYSAFYAHEKKNCVNDAEWNGYPAKTLLIKQWDGSDDYAMVQNSQVHYWRESIVWHAISKVVKGIEKGWQEVRLDEGYRYYLNTRETAAKSTDGSQATEPVLLNGAGAKLDKGSIPNSAVYNTFKNYKEIDFSEVFGSLQFA